MNKNIIVLVVVALLLVGGWFVLKGDNTTATPTPEVSTQPEASAVMEKPEATASVGAMKKGEEVAVTISNFAFSPKTVTVKKGTKVTWTNQDSIKHNVVSDAGSELAGELLAKGESYSHVFEKAGTYAYHCQPHPNMKATIVVE